MADANATEAPESKLPLWLPIVNAVALLVSMGAVVYTRLLFSRPQITEESERERLVQVVASPTPPPVPELVQFDQLVLNIQPMPGAPKPADGTSTQIEGKLHYCTLSFALEIIDSRRKTQVEEIRPLLVDKLLSVVGRKKFHELNTVQGRYVLKSQIIDAANNLVASRSQDGNKDALVSQVFFTQFVLQ